MRIIRPIRSNFRFSLALGRGRKILLLIWYTLIRGHSYKGNADSFDTPVRNPVQNEDFEGPGRNLDKMLKLMRSVGGYHISYDLRERCITLDDRYKLRGFLGNGDIFGVFVWKDYRFLDVAGREVIDVGANIGDSSMFFAMQGAKRIVSVEASKKTFATLKQNVESSGLLGRVIPVNKMLSSITGSNKIEQSLHQDAGFVPVLSTNGEPLSSVTLEDLAKEFSLEDPVLKLDCEGCEFMCLCEAETKTLRRFRQIELEYHHNPLPLIVKLRGSGFKVVWNKARR